MNQFDRNRKQNAVDYFLMYGQIKSIEEAYKNGYDCGVNGVNSRNGHFENFSSPEKTKAWEEGKADAMAGKPSKFQP